MDEYYIYINGRSIVEIRGTEAAYTKFRQTCELFDGCSVSLVWGETGEIVADNRD